MCSVHIPKSYHGHCRIPICNKPKTIQVMEITCNHHPCPHAIPKHTVKDREMD